MLCLRNIANFMKQKYFFSIILVILLCSSFSFAYATQMTDKKINDKIENQEKEIKNGLGDQFNIDNGSKYDNMLDSMEERQKTTEGIFEIEKFRENSSNFFMSLTLNTRKFAIPIFIIMLMYNIIMIGIVGSKSMNKRKFYILNNVTLLFLLLLYLNLPIVLIYFKNTPLADVLNKSSMLNYLYSVIKFMNVNSITIGSLVISYGVINKILGKNDVARKMQGNYLIKVALVLILVLKVTPILISVII
jgi:hypothetical protein